MCWCTPQDFYEKLNTEFNFTVDVAANPGSAKCEHFYTPLDDGLSKSWGGETVWCNPPYGRSTGLWVKKAYEETTNNKSTIVVMLIPARTDTSYWHDYIFGRKAYEIRFVRGRLKFTDEDGVPKDPAPFPSAVIIWRSKDVKFRKKIRKDNIAACQSKNEKEVKHND